MVNRSLLLILAIAVAAAEGRARGAKLGHRQSKQFPFWSQSRQTGGYNTPNQNPAPSPVSTGGYPATPTNAGQQGYQTGGAAQSTGYQQAGGGGYQTQVAPAGAQTVDSSVCKEAGYFPVEGTCKNFIVCVDWYSDRRYFSAFSFQCPLGTVYDDQLYVCNHPWAVSRPDCASSGSNAVMAGGHRPIVGYPGAQVGGNGVVYPGGEGAVYPQPIGNGEMGLNNPSALFTLTCATDGTLQRHPLYCNKYYACLQVKDDWEFKTLKCPKDLLFDGPSQKCVDPSMATVCEGQIAPYPDADVGDGSTDAGATNTSSLPLDPNSQYACMKEGYFPFEHDCVRFYKCSVTTENTLIGYRYKCPEGYGYSDEKQRCAAETELPDCDKQPLPASLRGSFPAIELSVAQLRWFFDH